MAAIQLSGLASGLDWQSLVDKLIAAERVPQDNLRTQKSALAQKTSAFGALTSNLTALQTSIKALAGDTGSVFATRAATIANASTTWTASAAPGTAPATYQFDVMQLATKAQRLGAADAGSALSTTSDVSGVTIATMPVGTAITAGDFTVNGSRITLATTDSLQDVLDQISAKTGGSVTASYDPTSDKIRLSSGGEIVLGSANDTSNFLGALQLFNNGTGEVLAPKALGVVSVSAAITNANLRNAVSGVDPSGDGSFKINGVDIAYNVNSDSIASVLARINASSAGVTAAFDRGNDRFTLTNNTTGDVGIAVSENAGGLLAALGIDGSSTLSRGNNALYAIDGGPIITSTSNTFEPSTHGIIGLSVTANSETAESVTVANDNSGARAKIDDFLKSYNAVQSWIENATRSTTSSDGKVTAALFARNREVGDIAKQLRSRMFEAVPGLSGSITRLENIGIDFKTSSSQLEIKDSTKLDAALRNRDTDVKTLFSSKPDGLAARLDSFITKVTGSTGAISTQTTLIAHQTTTLDGQIASMERRLTQQKNLLTQSFIRMEQAQSGIQSQLTALNNAFGTSSSK